MRSIVPMRMAKIGYIVLSVVLCALGVWFILCPEMSVSAIGITMGIVMILFGAVKLVGYFSRDLYRLAFQYDLAFGILLIALGVILLVRPESLLHFLCVALGISILADGLFKLQIAVDSKRFGLREWWLILVLAILTGACGAVLTFRPSESSLLLTTLLGISLIFEGVLNLSTVITAVKIVRHQLPDDYSRDDG